MGFSLSVYRGEKFLATIGGSTLLANIGINWGIGSKWDRLVGPNLALSDDLGYLFASLP